MSVRFEGWSASWSGLESKAARGLAIPDDDFGRLRGNHVFAYAGPSCFYSKQCIGDALLYFDPAAENGRTGSTTPFDSGSLEDPSPKLMPWAQQSIEARWTFLEQQMIPLAGWREHFATWLSRAYDAPDRYLETASDRCAAGEPDRLDPPELLEHNGSRGREKYGPNECGDRRAWTWEVRIAWRLPFEHVRALHVPFDALQQALEVAEKLRWSTGETPTIETLAPEVAAHSQTLYEDSGRVLRELVKDE
ncbi:hypothetical protein [Polyangium sorediatum]|uniref:Uncharacterized protein n=1 Tax=Polyangium sorediatum TaxID=889274 RepID=A0ABT6NRU7_9BACT|nr:hypothetical protein [Polyangium sorediatum]MDI1430892.1 hypothetical protein [Polyangium sorediatum]